MDDQYYRKGRVKFEIPGMLKKLPGNKTLFITLLIAVPLFSFITFSNRGILKRMSLESERAVMMEKVKEAQLEQQRLQKFSKSLGTDTRAIEKVAREKYGMIRPGETVYKVKKEK